MYPFPHSVHPALRSHIDAQVAFFNDLSQAMSSSFQQVSQLNMQLQQTLFEEATRIGQGLLTSERPVDAMSATASRAQAATEKMRAYQQQLSQLAADAQVDLARVTELHVPATTRTARALADDVTRTAAEETDKRRYQQEEAIKHLIDPFKPEDRPGEKTGARFHGNLQGSAGEANARMETDGTGRVSVQGTMQGNQARQSASKHPGRTR